jgi:hypothetical protein
LRRLHLLRRGLHRTLTPTGGVNFRSGSGTQRCESRPR